MMDRRSVQPAMTTGHPPLDAGAEANLCEACYDLILDFGLEAVLIAVSRAVRVRAADYMQSSRRLYLRHQRASSRLMAAYRETLRDAEQVDKIVEEEANVGQRAFAAR